MAVGDAEVHQRLSLSISIFCDTLISSLLRRLLSFACCFVLASQTVGDRLQSTDNIALF